MQAKASQDGKQREQFVTALLTVSSLGPKLEQAKNEHLKGDMSWQGSTRCQVEDMLYMLSLESLDTIDAKHVDSVRTSNSFCIVCFISACSDPQYCPFCCPRLPDNATSAAVLDVACFDVSLFNLDQHRSKRVKLTHDAKFNGANSGSL